MSDEINELVEALASGKLTADEFKKKIEALTNRAKESVVSLNDDAIARAELRAQVRLAANI